MLPQPFIRRKFKPRVTSQRSRRYDEDGRGFKEKTKDIRQLILLYKKKGKKTDGESGSNRSWDFLRLIKG